jgi:cation diffusion facilitator CzcD-associated flavoprotein CzcO
MIERTTDDADTDLDVLIVGAGISGIGAACHLRSRLPGKRIAILDAREAIGGTWDLFRYPGVRSDSDLHTFAYEFKPWTGENMIADGHEIVAYLEEAAREHGVLEHLRFGHRVLSASWSGDEARWTVRVAHDGREEELTTRVLFSATGYYDHARGFAPEFPGAEDFAGRIVHPQAWPEDLDHAGQRVVVIGSGATAVTLVPAMARSTAHVTMLQRSPTYIVPVPRRNALANAMNRVLPEALAYRITRRLNVAVWRGVYNGCQRWPRASRRLIRAITRRLLPAGYPVDEHFKPRYDPWDQRLCAVPDGDLFRAIKDGRASVVTDRIDRFTETGIRLESGRELEADVVVTATGLRMLPFGGIDVSVDGRRIDFGETVTFKSMMLGGVPNFAFAFGYTNIAWTLKVDLVCEHFCRLLAHMDEGGWDVVVPELDDPTLETSPFLDFDAGYVQRGIDAFPRRGSHGPWTVEMGFVADRERLRRGGVEDPALRFSTADRRPAVVA